MFDIEIRMQDGKQLAFQSDEDDPILEVMTSKVEFVSCKSILLREYIFRPKNVLTVKITTGTQAKTDYGSLGQLASYPVKLEYLIEKEHTKLSISASGNSLNKLAEKLNSNVAFIELRYRSDPIFIRRADFHYAEIDWDASAK